MQIDPQWVLAGCAGVTVMITWTSSIFGAAIWLMRRLDGIKKEILTDFQTKHDENSRKVDALETLVIRHDTMLDPEFNGSSVPVRRARP